MNRDQVLANILKKILSDKRGWIATGENWITVDVHRVKLTESEVELLDTVFDELSVPA